jgi:aspartate aminotransferase
MPCGFEEPYRLTPEVLESSLASASKTCETLLVVLNSPGNPDGMSYTAQELKSLVEVLKKYRALCISDEIYGPLHHTNQRNPLHCSYQVEKVDVPTRMFSFRL